LIAQTSSIDRRRTIAGAAQKLCSGAVRLPSMQFRLGQICKLKAHKQPA